MKIQNLLITTILAMSVTQAAIAQFEASSQAVTIALTGKYQEPGYEDEDGNPTEESYTSQEGPNGPTKEVNAIKINAKAYKVGNKEILQLALGEDVSTSGWSIVYKDGVMSATKKNQEPITLDDIDVSEFAEMEEFTASEVTTTTYKYNKDGESTATQTYAGSGTIEGPVTITYGESEMIGYVSGSYKAVTWYLDPTDKSQIEEPLNLPGAVKITGLSGSQEGDNGYEVFTGSVNLAAAKANKVASE
jgi:hypothetical protein